MNAGQVPHLISKFTEDHSSYKKLLQKVSDHQLTQFQVVQHVTVVKYDTRYLHTNRP